MMVTQNREKMWSLFLALPGIMLLAALISSPLSAQTDQQIWDLIRDAGSSEDYPGASRVVVFDRTRVEVEESGLAHVHKHILRKILDEQGVLGESVKRFNYDPASNMIRLESIRIFRRDGGIEEVDLSGVRDEFAPARAIYWGGRMKVISLPRLEVGDAVEIKTYKKGFEIAYLDDNIHPPFEMTGCSAVSEMRSDADPVPPRGGIAGRSEGEEEQNGSGEEEPDDSRYIPPMEGHYYDVVIFQSGHPIREKKYELILPRGKPINYQVYHGSLKSSRRFDRDKTRYAWWLEDIPPLEREPRMPALSDVATKLVLATVSSWEEKSRWFAAIHDTIFDFNDAIRKKALEITGGLDSDMEKVAALTHWAAQEIRYLGISMGEGEGYTIHPGWMIFHDRCGVCKDKAGMLITLMRSLGYEVYPALTMAGSKVEDIPADQFNHSVVAWRRKDGTYTMLDPTWVVNSTELWSSAEQEQNYVIGTPRGEDLSKTPYSPPEDHLLRIESRGEVDENGKLRGKMRIWATNYMDQRLRRYLGNHRIDHRRAYLEGWLSSISPRARLLNFSIGDREDFSSQFVVEFEYEIPRYALVSDNSVDFQLPAMALAYGNPVLLSASTSAGLEQRDYPLFIWFTQSLECDERITVPRHFQPEGDDCRISRGEEFASFEAEIDLGRQTVNNRARVLINNRLVPAEGYPGFKGVLDRVGEYAGRRVVAVRKQ